MDTTEYRRFVQSVIDNVKKHGFPEQKVAFPIEQLYEAAHKKGINFNKVLESLDEIQIAHEKTPEKIIFFPKDRHRQEVEPNPAAPFAGMDPSAFQGKSPAEMMSAVASMMKAMSPEQLEAIKSMYENMSDEERAAILEQAKKLGLF